MLTRKLSMREVSDRLPATQNEAFLYAYLRETSPAIGYGTEERFPVVLVLPGGAYVHTSDREADPVALQFLAAGYHAFTLRYSCTPDRYPAALLQTAAAIAWIRRNAASIAADPDRIYVCGFSAGGHLAASAGILWKEPVVAETLGVEAALCRPNGMILCYPVLGAASHANSILNLLGPDAAPEAVEAQALAGRVDGDSAPAFIWHTFPDVLPVEHALTFAAALRGQGVPFELHIYPEGPHGLSVCNRQSWVPERDDLINPHCASWMNMCLEWLELQRKKA